MQFPSFFLNSEAVDWCFLRGSVVKNLPSSEGNAGSISGSGRSPGEGNGNNSNILAWEIPWTEELGGLPSKGLQRVRDDFATEQQQQTADLQCCVKAIFKIIWYHRSISQWFSPINTGLREARNRSESWLGNSFIHLLTYWDTSIISTYFRRHSTFPQRAHRKSKEI